ncbi:MAG: FAD-dependent oxidoreductase, partial [Pseudomonadota bacterium]
MPPQPIAPTPQGGYPLTVETLIVGGGAAGLTAALAAHEAGQQVLVIEADPVPRGSTALSAGLIPAAGTTIQRAAGISGDSPAAFARDIQSKAQGENDTALVDALAQGAAPVIDWLTDVHALPFSLVTDFDYPGHTHRRMHGLPSRSGAELIDALRAAAEGAGIDILCGARAETLHHQGRVVTGLTVRRADGDAEQVGCTRLILACNGFGGNRGMVATHMPDIADALWFGHDGNRGEAVIWGEALGAATCHLGAYQGHGNVAHPHGILITWAVITEGGVQVNLRGERFWDESQGYSEAARAVLS